MQPDSKQPLKHMAHEVLHDLVHFDDRLFRTLPVLIFRPGKLTQSAINGDKDLYVRPVALFVFLNFLFFIFKDKGLFAYSLGAYQLSFPGSIADALAETHLSLALLTERFNTAMHFEQKEYLVIMVPLFALVLQLLFLAQRRGFVAHLVFALHIYAFFIIFLVVTPYIMSALGWLITVLHGDTTFMHTQLFLTFTILLVMFTYLLFAVKLVYKTGWLISILKSAVLSCCILWLIGYVFRNFLFFTVMHTVKEL